MIPQELQRPTTAVVDLDALAFNYHSTKEFIGEDIPCMAVVKANAYGHGSVECARRLESEGVEWFAVATLEEGIELRDAGISTSILILGGLWPGQEIPALDRGLTPCVYRLDQAESFNAAAAAKKLIAKVHIKIDTGMGRIGFQVNDIPAVADRLARLANIEVDGLMTHFASADDLSKTTLTELQISRFYQAVEVFRSFGFKPSYIDMANSPAAVAHPRSRANLVRLGGVLYGLGGDVLPKGIETPELRPVMAIRSKIALLKNITSGSGVGYGLTYRAERDSVIATIPMGYHDGFSRSLSNLGRVIINGMIAPVVGRISMDWTTVDVSDIHDVSIGDSVTVIGTDGDVTIRAEDIARSIGTISYEVTCGIGPRVPRTYVSKTKNI